MSQKRYYLKKNKKLAIFYLTRDNLVMNYSDTIKTQLRESGISLDDFTQSTGVARATLYRVLGGKNDPRLSSLEKLLMPLGYKLAIVPIGTDQTNFPQTPPVSHTPES